MEKFHQSRVPDVLGATISLTLLASVAVGARFLARKLSAARIWWDDYILLVALVGCSVLKFHATSLTISGAELGPQHMLLA